jgi:hypothetical protein
MPPVTPLSRPGHGAKSAICTKRTAVPPGGYSPSVIANVQARRLSPGTLVAHNWPTKSRNHPAGSRPPGVRAQLPTVRRSRTQRNPARTSRRTVTCGNTPPKGAVPDAQSPPPPGAGRAGRRPLTCPDLARNWPTGTVDGPRNRSRAHIRPGPQTGPDLGLCVAGVGSNQPHLRRGAILSCTGCRTRLPFLGTFCWPYRPAPTRWCATPGTSIQAVSGSTT